MQAPSSQEQPQTPPQKKRILVIDDDISLIELVKLALEDTGKYEVASELNPSNALKMAHSFRPHLILLDLVMPQMTGSEVYRVLHQDPVLCAVPIIIVSALVSNFSTLGKPVEHEGHLLIGKPIQLDQLICCVEERLAVAK